ncbi:MAG: Up-frameshift suppressor 2-domain-containing protein, partial [Olpidium bornovanus]
DGEEEVGRLDRGVQDGDEGDAEVQEDDAAQENHNTAGMDEDEVVLRERQRAMDEADMEADAEFEREFTKLMSESVDSRKFERKAAFDLSIPMKVRAQSKAAAAEHGDDEDRKGVAFTLLTKKGNKQQLRTMEIPSDSPLALNTKSQQEAEREEQQKLKQLVLSYEQRESQGFQQPQGRSETIYLSSNRDLPAAPTPVCLANHGDGTSAAAGGHHLKHGDPTGEGKVSHQLSTWAPWCKISRWSELSSSAAEGTRAMVISRPLVLPHRASRQMRRLVQPKDARRSIWPKRRSSDPP